MEIHKKCWPVPFERVHTGKKKVELRLADSEYKEGDTLVLEEWDPKTKQYTGRSLKCNVSYVIKTRDQKFWPAEDVEKHGFLVLQIEPENQEDGTISWEDFEKVDMRVGKIIRVEDFPEAKKPAYKLFIDFGKEIGMKQSSAQVVKGYEKNELIGRQVIAVVNFPLKQIGPFKSEVLVVGAVNTNGDVRLLKPEPAAGLGEPIR